MNKDQKAALRRELLERRKALTAETVRRASLAVAGAIRCLSEWKNARQVLLYWPVRGEVDTRPLMAELWQRGVEVLLPRCREAQPGIMDLACVSCETDLRPGMFAIMEPNEATCPVMHEYEPDVALIPGVGYAPDGTRLGFGGGYYDRLLAEPCMRQTLTIGLCYEFQKLDKLPAEDWDQPVRAICTENELCRI
ncbi:5-formyltetrahydrofolate cyclo-ligase [Salidesulfovibrio onnuriiensis]|uniref:5-formyltetrahydrofolate cyclo-ligase n=1 Tax=Salidesulfovibrio onnuriiensis TaxID=2583823 RepID=UPI0011CCA2E7|nr:5-formyltetrahydrofolate cyclo-ligase [Salidesulfovibrio onnuriiensis]